ncbi:MAG: hydrogenase subunit MbhD domain-containing protein [Stellaceae bacterium]
MTILLVLTYLLAAAAGAGVVFSREPRRQVLALAINEMALALLFMALQAPDVAYPEIVVGTAALPLMYLALLVSLKTDRSEKK